MARVVGVRFRNVGKIYYFDPKDYAVRYGSHVIVETARGMEYGKVVLPPKEVEENEVVHPLKEVLRMANEEDDRREKENRDREREAFRVCQQKIREHNLDMKLIDAEYTFDNNKVLFYFTADGRIDFRQLVKDLASIFKTRIELRQIGVRDETKILGGIGICGRCLCCHTYLSEFAPVSIKMAKEQNLSLNQTKISGVCGRLMCCLKNEQETYEELNKRLPGIGDAVFTPDGLQGTVHSINVLRQLVKVTVEVNDEKELQEYPASELRFRPRKKRGKITEQELREMEGLEEFLEGGKAEQKEERREESRENRRNDRKDEKESRNREGRRENRKENRREDRKEDGKEEKREGRKEESRENRRNDRKDEKGERREDKKEEPKENRRDDQKEDGKGDKKEGRREGRRRDRRREDKKGESRKNDRESGKTE